MPCDGMGQFGVLVVGLGGCPAVGCVGAGLELAAKQINKESYPVTRSVLETATKVIQAAAAAIAFFFYNAISSPQPIVGVRLGVAIGAVMVLTHILNGIAENTNNETLKNILRVADKVVSCASKVINTGVLTFFVVSMANPIIGVITGLVTGAVSLAALLKQDPVQPKQPVEKPVGEAIRA